MKKTSFYLLFTLFYIISCDEPIDIDIDQAPPVPVIEAQFTNVPSKNYVKVSMSQGLFTNNIFDPVINASVQLVGTDGISLNFLPYSGSNPDSIGFYLPDQEASGQIGEGYTLTVNIDGETYMASDSMMPINPIDSLKTSFNETIADEPDFPGRVYDILTFSRQNPLRKDYFLFRFYRNDSLIYGDPDAIYAGDDEVFNEQIIAAPSPIQYAIDDKAEVQLIGISRKAYLYFLDIQFLINSDGGLFSPPPTNPRNNISGEAQGIFLVGYVESESIIVTEE